jgi:serine/threonine protein kinase
MKLSTLIGQTLDDKYFIDKQLGKGGMGAVFLATHIGTGRPVALKVIAPQFMTNDEFVERFRREAKAAGRLRHPNVVNVTDFGFASVATNRLAYLVMEYLDGCSLGDILAEERRLPIEWVVDILEQVCSAVDEAHKQGIVHRDLKPDNIWLEPNRRGGYTVKVLDFGLAKLGDPSQGRDPGQAADSNGGMLANSLPSFAGEATRALANDEAKTMAQSKRTQVMEANTVFQPAGNDEEACTQVLNQEAQTQLADQQQTEVRDAEEAVTQLQMPEDLDGAATKLKLAEEAPDLSQQSSEDTPTRIFQPPVEAETRILDQQTIDEERTRILTDPLGDSRFSSASDSADGLTRVGSVLGTPLYMSPEQCAGLPLDARTDVYSLGIIAYQMLTGATPFEGDMMVVMRHHSETNPPPFRDRQVKTDRKKKYQIPRRTEELVLSALAKNPEYRPQSAAAFGDMLRASAEGAGALLRRAVAVYGEYFNKFFAVSILVNIPNILLLLLAIFGTVLFKAFGVSQTSTIVTQAIFALLKIIVSFLAGAALSGMTVWMVTRLMLAPLRPLRVRRAFGAFKRRLKPFLTTTALVSGIFLLLLLLCVAPGIIFMVVYALTMPVVMMENLSGRKAMKRARELSKRARLTVAFIVLTQFGIPFLYSLMVNLLINVLGKLAKIDPLILQRGQEIMRLPVDILLTPLIAIMTALLYLKMRQAGGENLDEVLRQFEEENLPQTKWQKRMRDRLSVSTQPSK